MGSFWVEVVRGCWGDEEKLCGLRSGLKDLHGSINSIGWMT
jgi:hypothetical protein